ncbi:MAG TPA: TIGR03016 family PEP-CTERM system-associated outer membrane protein [Geobacteraceae bacterium]|nr:TIGR03016 family PEP-CTERM system-associated outer membrane protein [Geobacteraceae bacterium]
MKLTALFVMVGVVFFAQVAGAEFQIHPSIGVGEEYNDNVFASSTDRKTDFITHGMPGLSLKYKTPYWDFDVDYLFDYRYYAKNTLNNDYTHDLKAHGLITAINNLLFLDVSEVYQRVSLNITRNFATENLVTNQTNSNIVTASPYVTLKPFSTVNTKIGYIYSNIWYQDPTAISKQEHEGFINVDYEISPKFFINSGYNYTHADARQDPQLNNYDKHNVFIGPRYEYAEKSFIYGQGGYTFIDYASGQRFNNPFWNVGLTHNFDPYTVTLETAVQYVEDPTGNLTQNTSYTGTLGRKITRGSIAMTLGYFEYKDMMTDQKTTTTYSAGLKGTYELLPRLTSSLEFSADKYHHNQSPGGYTRHFYVNPIVTYELFHDFTVALNYSFVDYYSPTVASDNYHMNRVLVEVKKVF